MWDSRLGLELVISLTAAVAWAQVPFTTLPDVEI